MMIEHIEPTSGTDSTPVTIRVTREEAIKTMRALWKRNFPRWRDSRPDDEVIEDYMALHWAKQVKEVPDGEKP
jgi:hypothetical protein